MANESRLSQMNIAIVDDHDLIREGLHAVLAIRGVSSVEKFSTATDLVSRLDKGECFDFYVIDLELPDMDGFVLIENIRARYSEARIIVSTVHDEIWTLRKLLARDVNAIIYKSGSGNEIIAAMNEILDGNKYYCEAVQRVIDTAADSSSHPTSRELEVLNQMAQGKTSREIAAALFVSDNTIEAHRKALFHKLGAINAVDLIVKAVEKGYIKKNGSIR